MDEKLQKMLVRILYFALIFISVFMLLRNLAAPWGLLVLFGLMGLTFTFKKAVPDADPKKAGLSLLCMMLVAALILLMCLSDNTGIAPWLYFILIADIAFFMPSWAVTLAVPVFALQCFSLYIRAPGKPFANYLEPFSIYAIVLLALLTVISIIRYQAGQKQKLSAAMTELKVKSLQLNNAYMKLKEASEELEEMTIVMERNRIAREIHDTVGHTLTTVLLELEASERLIPVNPDLAAEKLQIAKVQVRKGLSDIRESVHTLKAGHEIMSLRQSLELLLEETQKSGIHIKSTIGELPKLSGEQEKMIYRALQEGLTNGIRHGGSTAFVFRLLYEEGSLRFYLGDNGRGAAGVEKGFGLSSMEERVKALGGTLQIHTAPDEGFNVSISIPVGQDEADRIKSLA